MELLRSTGKALSQRTSDKLRHPHSKGIDDALRPGALPRPASVSNPDRPPAARPANSSARRLPAIDVCLLHAMARASADELLPHKSQASSIRRRRI